MMKRSRLFGFIIAILIGLAAGLLYGWVINPVGVKNSTLDSMRSDYQTDYVLMVAEAYSVDQNTAAAIEMLNEVSPDDPKKAVQQALLTAQELGYSEREMRALTGLEMAFPEEMITATEASTP